MEDDLFNDLVESVKEMKAVERGELEPARVTVISTPDVAEVRRTLGLSQSEFSALLGVSKHTLTNWEQGRRNPSGAARTLLKVAAKNPEAVLAARD